MALSLRDLPTLAEIRAEQERRQKRKSQSPAELAQNLSEGKWQPAAHLNKLSEWLQDAAEGRRSRIIVTMPPRHGKSELISHWFPVWLLDRHPDWRVMLASYEADFAASWGRRVRNTIAQNQGRLSVTLSGDSAAANRWDTTQGGGMVTAGVGGPITGKGANVLIVDDPVKNAEEANSETIRAKVWEWWTSTAYTRLEPNGVAVVVMTRWHEDDLAGRLIAETKAGGEHWDVLNLPALAEGEDALGRKEGEPLWPWRFGVEALAKIAKAVGSYFWAALYQQRPSPPEGSMLKRGWWKYYRKAPGIYDEVVQSWDMAFKDTKASDFVVGQVWGRVKADKYLLDQVRGRMDFPTSVQAVKNLSAKWPEAKAKLVEDKANGTAVIATLKHEVPGLIPVEPQGGKVSRASAVSPEIEAGNVYLPDGTAWVGDFVDECAAFPAGAHDDQVDAMTQALLRMSQRKRTEIRSYQG